MQSVKGNRQKAKVNPRVRPTRTVTKGEKRKTAKNLPVPKRATDIGARMVTSHTRGGTSTRMTGKGRTGTATTSVEEIEMRREGDTRL